MSSELSQALESENESLGLKSVGLIISNVAEIVKTLPLLLQFAVMALASRQL